MSEGLMCLEVDHKIQWSLPSIHRRALVGNAGEVIYGRERFGAHFSFSYYYFYAFGGKLHVREAVDSS